MKKNFSFSSPLHKPDRQAELIKHEIHKYTARERRKALPAGVDFWDFDCRFGLEQESAETVHLTEIGKKIDTAFAKGTPRVYVEILAKPGVRQKKT